MSLPRSAAAATVCNESIYVIGGATKPNTAETTTVECFDSKNQTWSTVAEISAPRDYIAAVTINHDTIIAVGGFDPSSESTKIVEEYNVTQNKWCRKTDLLEGAAGCVFFTI